jgi:hypothetical protein
MARQIVFRTVYGNDTGRWLNHPFAGGKRRDGHCLDFLKGKNAKTSLPLINYHVMESYVVVNVYLNHF